MSGLKLYSYWRSSAAYRVRIALNLKGLPYELIPVHLLRDGGGQHHADYHALNPQELVPTLIDGERVVHQSLAIIEYLDETYEGEARLLPVLPRDRARVRALALAIACDIHPLNNLRVMQYLEREQQWAASTRDQWTRHWITEGFRAIEELVARHPATGHCCQDDTPTLADIVLIPQVYNALRFQIDLGLFPTLERIYRHCCKLSAFDAAKPESQPDAPVS